MNTTEQVIARIHNDMAELIGVFGGRSVGVAQDGVGTYINLRDKHNYKDYRGLTLADSGGEGNLTDYRWQFWNSTGFWLDSDLGAETGAEEILGFLKDSLMEEEYFLEERREQEVLT